MQKQTHPFHKIVVVGSTRIDQQTAKKTGVEYIGHANAPLSDKWQAAVYHAKKFDPDAILINGSDSWLSTNWNVVAKKYIEAGYHLVGKTEWYSCRVDPGKPLLIVQAGYKTRKDPVGAGRLFSREALEALDWLVYPKGYSSGLDGRSYRHMIKILGANRRVKLMNEHPKTIVMGVKSTTWATKTKFAFVQKAYGKQSLKNPNVWVEKYFPGSLKTFKELVPTVKI